MVVIAGSFVAVRDDEDGEAPWVHALGASFGLETETGLALRANVRAGGWWSSKFVCPSS